jgi:hypothetical protein
MTRLAKRDRQERGVFISESAARLGILPVIVEKDYWVCWLLELEPRTDSPVLWFDYESTLPSTGGYIVPAVKLEFGSLTDQRPVGRHTITPMLAAVLPDMEEETDDVVALEVERTFWEKATILHAEYHRPTAQPVGERFSRHYSDLAALWKQPAGAASLARLDLLERVALFKSRFFGSSWANYADAKLGTLRLVPPRNRQSELEQDYDKMQPMFLALPPEFGDVIATLREAEARINSPRSEE